MAKKINEVIETYNGEEAIRSECRKISGKFYKMGVQCFKMSDGKWHRINNGLIDFDNETKHWVLKSGTDLYNGIIGFDENEDPVYGKFTRDSIKNIEVITNRYGEFSLAISEDILTKNFLEVISSGKFIHKSIVKASGVRVKEKFIGSKYPFRLNYSFEHQFQSFKEYYEKHFSFNKDVTKKFHTELGETTFGVEFETYNGQIPVRHCYKTGLIPLKDGSLRHGMVNPFEYTTIPLQGERGLHTIKQSCELLNKYCLRNVDGSLHIHIGNIAKTPEYGISIFKVLYKIQDEMYKMFPEYFKETSKFKNTGKDYCKPLPKVEFNKKMDGDLSKLFNFYIHGETDIDTPVVMDEEEENANNFLRRMRGKQSSKYYMGMPHPSDNGFDHKWYVNYRYFWCNLIPLFFNKRGTVEFRVHTSTFNSDKVINWLFIVNAICRYAEKYQKQFIKTEVDIDLKGILKDIYSEELSDYLTSYSDFRKSMMKEHAEKDDRIGALEVKEDSLKKWDYPIKSLI